MPVDEENVDTLLANAQRKLEEVRSQMREVKQLIRNLMNIKLIPDPVDNKVKIKPQDIGLGKSISDARRQAVYDTSVADAVRLEI
jgi:hypothetical protein